MKFIQLDPPVANLRKPQTTTFEGVWASKSKHIFEQLMFRKETIIFNKCFGGIGRAHPLNIFEVP